MQTTGGMLNPPNVVKLIWGLVVSGTAAVLLTSPTGLEALQTASIIGALPFAIIIILMIWSLLKELRNEKNILTVDKERIRHERIQLRNQREQLKQQQAQLKQEQEKLRRKQKENKKEK